MLCGTTDKAWVVPHRMRLAQAAGGRRTAVSQLDDRASLRTAAACSRQHPQPAATPSRAVRSHRLRVPAFAASLICDSVTALQMQTYINSMS